MKKCTKCGKTFDDDAAFCTSCGERLVSGNACPRCGNIISEDDAFCGHCGYNLKQGNKCSKCGAEIKEGNKFCSKCGEPVQDNQYISRNNAHSRPSNLNTNVRSILNCVLIGFFFLVVLLSFIGFFGNIVTVKGFGVKDSITISYFFGEGADQLKSLETAYKYDNYYTFSMVFFIVHNIFYFGGFVALLVVLGFGLTRGVICLIKNELFPKKYFLWLLFCSLPYVMLTTYMMSLSTNVTLKLVLGWGTSMLAASIIICAVCFVLSSISDSISEKKNIAASVLFYSSLIFVILIALFGLTRNILIREEGVTLSTSPYLVFSASLMNISTNGAKAYDDGASMASFSFVFSLVVFALLPLSMSVLSHERKALKICSIALSTFVLVFSLISSILGASSLVYGYSSEELANVHTGLGVGSTLTIIFAILAIGSQIASLILQKDNNASDTEI